MLFISEAPALKGTGDLTQIPDAIFKEIELDGKKLCFVTDSRQCLQGVDCKDRTKKLEPDYTLAEFLKAESAKVSIENQACATFVIDIKHPQNPCVVSGGRVYC